MALLEQTFFLVTEKSLWGPDNKWVLFSHKPRDYKRYKIKIDCTKHQQHIISIKFWYLREILTQNVNSRQLNMESSPNDQIQASLEWLKIFLTKIWRLRETSQREMYPHLNSNNVTVWLRLLISLVEIHRKIESRATTIQISHHVYELLLADPGAISSSTQLMVSALGANIWTTQLMLITSNCSFNCIRARLFNLDR